MCLQTTGLQCIGEQHISTPDVDHVRELGRQVNVHVAARVLKAQFGLPPVIYKPETTPMGGLVNEVELHHPAIVSQGLRTNGALHLPKKQSEIDFALG